MAIKKKTKGNNVCFPEAIKSVPCSTKTKINLWMDSEMHRQLKMAAAEEEITVTSILCKGAQNYLKRKMENVNEQRN
jgi:hypothetical protein